MFGDADCKLCKRIRHRIKVKLKWAETGHEVDQRPTGQQFPPARQEVRGYVSVLLLFQ